MKINPNNIVPCADFEIPASLIDRRPVTASDLRSVGIRIPEDIPDHVEFSIADARFTSASELQGKEPMSGDDEDPVPESDPYCAHWLSVYDERHPDVPCENCGNSCREHLVLCGAWCPDAPEGTKDREHHAFKNSEWPVEEPVRPRRG